MDLHNVQKTGNMFYVYLPTAWCKKQGITSKSKVQVEMEPEGGLIINAKHREREAKKIELSIDEKNIEVINRLIVACYINPISSFTIKLPKELTQEEVLEQKKAVSLELMEVDGKTIICESAIMIYEPEAILKTIINKIKNIILVTTKNYNKELIHKYEEEIDRNRIMIDKAIISTLTFHQPQRTRTINLHYIYQISRDLERLTDHLILIEPKEKKFLLEVGKVIGVLGEKIDLAFKGKKFDYKEALDFIGKVLSIHKPAIKDIKSYYMNRVIDYLNDISEVLLDLAITDIVVEEK